MKYRLLGNSGLRVSELCLGTMTFGEDWGWGSPPEQSREVFSAFVEEGGNFFDTADSYTQGSSERLLGEFIRSERNKYVIATKYSVNCVPGDPNGGGNHRKNMRQALEGSLKRLGTDYIDLYWVHAWDEMTPIEEVMRGLDDLVRSGKVLYLGISDAPAWWIAKANTIAQLRGWTPFSAMQIEYNLLERTSERELIPAANHLGLTVMPWSPLAHGFLTGKYERGAIPEAYRIAKTEYVEFSDRNFAIVDELKKIAAERKATPAQIALAWVRQQSNALPIIGARTPKQLRENLNVLTIQLSTEELASLQAVSHIDLGFPLQFLKGETIRQVIHGGTYDLIKRDQ